MQNIDTLPSKLRVAGSSPAAPTKQRDLSSGFGSDPTSDAQPSAFSFHLNSISSLAVTLRISRGLFALIDAEDLDRVQAAGKWTAHWNGYTWYAVNRSKHVDTYLHRFLLDVPDDIQVDHKNHLGLDCRKENLRPATNSQNGAHKAKMWRVGDSQYKGVDRPHGSKWRARIRKDHKQELIGHFDTEEAAARAYDAKARELHGEFAFCNFPTHPATPQEAVAS